MTLIDLWRDKFRQGEIRYDQNLLVIGPVSCAASAWGTVYYSEAREMYKSRVSALPATSFDLELMEKLQLLDHGGLRVAANPNSLFEGHLVIYPKHKNPELTRADLLDITHLAFMHPEMTFIHNADESAASITDWAHFQAYALEFPIQSADVSTLRDIGGVQIGIVSEAFPAYAVRVSGHSAHSIATVLSSACDLLQSATPRQGARIPLNLIWRRNRAWIVPRADGQSERAARYFGGLEMGGIFCLPNQNEFGSYLPSVLRDQVEKATLRSFAERSTREWFETELGCRELLADNADK